MRGSGARIGAGRAIVVFAAVGCVLGFITVNNDEALVADWVGLALACALLVAAGALVNRTWAAQLPIAFMVCFVFGRAAIEGSGYDTWGELGVGGGLVLGLFFAAAMGVLVLLGVGV
ncbi:MAG TPA: hypothetical protein VGW75_07420, partial [Solirubrobacteraceae bacterium]|nr:hypothetical protein [Solirubrobacteraceae bacterium]